jgi:hypothetical protein
VPPVLITEVFDAILSGTVAWQIAPSLQQLTTEERQNVLCTVCAMRAEIARNCQSIADQVHKVLTAECPSTLMELRPASSKLGSSLYEAGQIATGHGVCQHRRKPDLPSRFDAPAHTFYTPQQRSFFRPPSRLRDRSRRDQKTACFTGTVKTNRWPSFVTFFH